jgi:hypothetical protein
MKATKTEIYFGEDEPGGKHVSLKAWRTFLSEVITPRFPDGMTVLEAYGQMQHASGRIEKQPSRVVVLVHPPGKAADRRIHEIIRAYRDRFQNAQVMLLRTAALVEFFPD